MNKGRTIVKVVVFVCSVCLVATSAWAQGVKKPAISNPAAKRPVLKAKLPTVTLAPGTRKYMSLKGTTYDYSAMSSIKQILDSLRLPAKNGDVVTASLENRRVRVGGKVVL